MMKRVVTAAVTLLMGAPLPAREAVESENPRSLDPRVTLERFAEDPRIVTPTGIAVNARGQVLVIESHTHFRPDEYQGPPADRIRLLEDTNRDGRADRVTTFYEGSSHTMNLAVYHDGSVFVATRDEIFRLFDDDADGTADRRQLLVKLNTPGNYPHNGLSGFAFDARGQVYFGMGENLGADYHLVGSDGSRFSGGEGGNIFRCDAEGGNLVRVAQGFWNPFHLCFDRFEQLLAVDNDPDSRPPCRLLHIVPGGDYGYRDRNGRRGLHPFTAWNGELPGTLPMTAGTGEAPSGMLVYESDALGKDYLGTLLVTSWGDHRIERYRLEAHGATIRSEAEPIIQGGENFRPVGIALAPDGSLYISDWVDKSYKLHGKGRVWRIGPSRRSSDASAEVATDRDGSDLSKLGTPPRAAVHDPRQAIHSRHGPDCLDAARALARGTADDRAFLRKAAREAEHETNRAAAIAALAAVGDRTFDYAAQLRAESTPAMQAMIVRLAPQGALDPVEHATDQANGNTPHHDDGPVLAAILGRLRDRQDAPLALAQLEHVDPFVRQAARQAVSRLLTTGEIVPLAKAPRAERRLQTLLLLRAIDNQRARQELDAFLQDADPRVRFAAVQWVGESRLTGYRDSIQRTLADGAMTRDLFSASLATLERLDGVQRLPHQELGGDQYIAQLLALPEVTPAVRSRALRALDPRHEAITPELLAKFLKVDDPELRLEAVRSLRDRPEPDARKLLRQIAVGKDVASRLRAAAILGLEAGDADESRILLQLTSDENPVVQAEALRSLRGAELTPASREVLEGLQLDSADQRALLQRVLSPTPQQRSVDGQVDSPGKQDNPSDAIALEQWIERLDGPADVEAGERIFFHPRGPACARCHQINGRGGRVGPDLSTIAGGLDRRRLIESIVAPSKEIAPRFVAWTLILEDGTIKIGLPLEQSHDGPTVYADSQGNTFEVLPGEVQQSAPQGISLMPAGLTQMMTPREFRDLMAYLEQLR
jgi:putative membrane-bound dehydrogenase-like protein